MNLKKELYILFIDILRYVFKFVFEISKRIILAMLVLVGGDSFLFSIYQPPEIKPVVYKDDTNYVKDKMKVIEGEK